MQKSKRKQSNIKEAVNPGSSISHLNFHELETNEGLRNVGEMNKTKATQRAEQQQQLQ